VELTSTPLYVILFLIFLTDITVCFILQYTAVLAVLYFVELILFRIAFNVWLNFNVTAEEAMGYRTSEETCNVLSRGKTN
jgi:hypothetical protein